MTRSWQPLLQGRLAEQAAEAVQQIAAELPDPTDRVDRRGSLAGGRAGQAVFYAYLALHTGNETAADHAATLLEAAADELSNVPLPPSFYSGFSGIAWAIEHLQGRLFEPDPDGDDPVLEIDQALIAPLSRSPWPADYDLVGGLIGLGMYALERLPRPSGVELLTHVVDRLAERAERSEEGAAWFSQPESLPEWQRELSPRGNFNLGVAHGLPGAFPVLAGAVAAGVAVDRARPLLDDIVRWLLARRLEGMESCYGTNYAPWQPSTGSRLAWCYGDPGIAATLLVAARAVGEPAWEAEAVRVGLAAAQRPSEGSLVRDAGLCHGAAGLAHLFNRMYQTTGEERLAAAARNWFEQTLSLRHPGEGIAGFQAWELAGNEKPGWRDDAGFLEGAAGIGLALLGGISEIEPAWDRILALSIPPAGGEPEEDS
jgi:lantibiotic modifying enzyme